MTEVTLLLQASNGVPMLALARGDEIIFDSTKRPEFDGSRDYRAMLEAGFAATGITLSDLTLIGCDIGPGGLGVTRTAAAFANGLSYARGIPLRPVPAFALLGAEVATAPDRPVVILRRAGRPFVHFGIFEGGTLSHYAHCEESRALKDARSMDKCDFAGNLKHEALPDEMINAATAETMLKCVFAAPDEGLAARSFPIVEELS